MVWAVFAPTSRKAGALAGNYAGAAAESDGRCRGLAPTCWFGGSDRMVSLQAGSVQGQSGWNLAVGVSGFNYARRVELPVSARNNGRSARPLF